MAEVIDSFLVGIGYDYDNKGEKDVVSGLDGIKSKALQMGAVLGAGAGVVGFLTANFAESRDELGKFAQVFGVTANDVYGLGNALKQEGGTLDSFMSQIEGIERTRAAALKGDFSVFEEAGISGANAGAIMGARNATEAYIALGDQFARMSGKQRLNAANAFGLDESSIRLLSKGSSDVRGLMELYQKMRPVTGEMTAKSAEYNDQIHILKENIGGFGDIISNSLIDPMTDAVSGMNAWVDVNREFINQNIEGAIEGVGESMIKLSTAGAVITGGGLLVGLASMAKSIPLIGSGLSAIAGAAGTLAILSGTGYAGHTAGSLVYDNLDNDTRSLIGRSIAQTLAFFGNDEAAQALASENRVNNFNRPVKIEVPVIIDGKVIERKVIDVNERQNEQALEEIRSPSEG